MRAIVQIVRIGIAKERGKDIDCGGDLGDR